jgi:hypothetical protein
MAILVLGGFPWAAKGFSWVFLSSSFIAVAGLIVVFKTVY